MSRCNICQQYRALITRVRYHCAHLVRAACNALAHMLQHRALIAPSFRANARARIVARGRIINNLASSRRAQARSTLALIGVA